MVPVGLAVIWLSYTTGIWGYCLVRGYNVKFTQLFGAAWPGASAGSGKGTVSAGVQPTPTGQQTAAQQAVQ